MAIPQPSFAGGWPAIQPPHATAATAPKSALLSTPSNSHSGPLFAKSTALRETLLVCRRRGGDGGGGEEGGKRREVEEGGGAGRGGREAGGGAYSCHAWS